MAKPSFDFSRFRRARWGEPSSILGRITLDRLLLGNARGPWAGGFARWAVLLGYVKFRLFPSNIFNRNLKKICYFANVFNSLVLQNQNQVILMLHPKKKEARPISNFPTYFSGKVSKPLVYKSF